MSDKPTASSPVAVHRTPEEQRDYYLEAIAESLAERGQLRRERDRLAEHARTLEKKLAQIRALIEDEPPTDPDATGDLDTWQAGHRTASAAVARILDTGMPAFLAYDFTSHIEWYHDGGDTLHEPERCQAGDWRMGGRCDSDVRHIWCRTWQSRLREGARGEDGTLVADPAAPFLRRE